MAKRAPRNTQGWRVSPEVKTKRTSDCKIWRIFIKHNIDGKEVWKSKIFHGNKTDAIKKAKELKALADIENKAVKVFPNGTNTTVEELLNKLNETKFATGAISKNTYEKRSYMNKAVSRIIGTLKVVDVSAADIERVFIAVQNGNTPSGRVWNQSSIATLSSTMHDAFSYAVINQLIAVNPVVAASKPKNVRNRRDGLSIDDETALMNKLNPYDYHDVCLGLMMEGGLRVGEACGLQWDDIEDGIMNIAHTMNSDGTLGPTKNRRTRSVPVSERLDAFLEQVPHHCEYVVSNPLKMPLRPNGMQSWWRRRRDEWGYPGMTLHELGRHTFATNLAEADVHPRLMQELLGHASIKTSMEVYTHVHQDQLKEAMAKKGKRSENR